MTEDLSGSTLRAGLLVEAKIGEGSFGAVYRGRQLAIGREVAIKVLHPWFSGRDEAARLFQDEIRAIGSIDHPNVVRVFDADSTADGRVYFVMELLRGTTMQQLADAAPLPTARAVELAAELVAGLAAVHAAGHIHADVKPSNVIVVDGATPRAVLIDFGLARLQQRGATVEAVGGTRAFMAPEQLRNWKLDERSDVYSAALVLLRLLTGWQRATADEPAPTLERISDPAIRLALERALATEPSHRPSALDFGRALRGGPADELSLAMPSPPFRQLAPMTERDRGRFQGREADVLRLMRTLTRDRPVIFTAPSGTGKTSVLRAGLVPYLDAGGIDHVYVASHGDTPLDVAGTIHPGTTTIAEAFGERRKVRDRRLVVILDQIESLFTAPPTHAAVVAELLEYAQRGDSADIEVVLSVREDFVARLVASTPLLARGAPQLRLGPLTRAGAERALQEPLSEHGVTIEPALNERVLDDLTTAGKVLGIDHGWTSGDAVYPPHLQLTGTALFAALEHGERTLTSEHYNRLGGFEAIVGEHLERILEELSADDRAIARDLFLALVASGQTRAVRSEDELVSVSVASRSEEDVRRVLRWLAERRLVVSRVAADGSPRWELIHDSLVQRITAWLSIHDLDRRRAAEVIRFHLRESAPGAPSLLSTRQLQTIDRFPGLVEELEREWQRRPSSAWTPKNLVERSFAVARYRRGVAAAVGIAVVAVTGLLADRYIREREARQHELSLRDRDLGRFELVFAPFKWAMDPTTKAPVAIAVNAAQLPDLRWSLHEPSEIDPGLPGPPVEALRFRHGRSRLDNGERIESGIDARGGDAVIVVEGRGEGHTGCPPSIIPIRRLPGYSQRLSPPRLRVRVPTCEASRFDVIDVPAGPFVAGGMGTPAAPQYTAADMPPEDRARLLRAYAIDRTEITNAAYQVFAGMADVTGFAVGIYPTNLAYASGPTYPRTDINAADAAAYCRFLGKDLPTSDQWQKALRGGPRLPDGSLNPLPDRNLPWGEAIAPVPTNLADTGVTGPAPVGSSPLDTSPLGVVDLAGNVQEWTRTEAPLPADAAPVAPWLRPRVTRGGNWSDTTSEFLLGYMASENERSPRQVNFFQGARCVLESSR